MHSFEEPKGGSLNIREEYSNILLPTGAFSAFYGKHPVAAAWTNPSPWMITFCQFLKQIFRATIRLLPPA